MNSPAPSRAFDAAARLPSHPAPPGTGTLVLLVQAAGAPVRLFGARDDTAEAAAALEQAARRYPDATLLAELKQIGDDILFFSQIASVEPVELSEVLHLVDKLLPLAPFGALSVFFAVVVLRGLDLPQLPLLGKLAEMAASGESTGESTLRPATLAPI